MLASAYISPLCNLWAHIFKLFSTLLAISRKNGPKIGTSGIQIKRQRCLGSDSLLHTLPPNFDANQTRYLQFLDRHGLSDQF